MKVKNIAFSGFMASILMAGAAYAAGEVPTLATDQYVIQGVNYAISQAGDLAQAAYEDAADYTDAEILKITTGQTVAAKATSATQDGDGNVIATTYLTKTDAASDYDAKGAADTAKSEAIAAAASDATSKANAAQAAAESTAAGALTSKVGAIGDVTVKAYVDSAVSAAQTAATYDDTELAGRVTTAEGKIGTLEGTVGDANGGLVKGVADNAAAISGLGTSKQNALTTEQLAAANSGIDATKRAAYDAHVADGTIHVTAAQKTEWSGKQDAITASSKLGADFIDDSTSENKFVSATEKSTWNAKQAALTTEQLAAVGSGITAEKVSGYDSHIADDDIHVTSAEKSTWNAKQDAISDLETIRSGAAAGATAVQQAGLNTALAGKQDTIDSGHKLSADLVSGLGTAAKTDSSAYATADQGAKADTALQANALKCSSGYCLLSESGALTPIATVSENSQWGSTTGGTSTD